MCKYIVLTVSKIRFNLNFHFLDSCTCFCFVFAGIYGNFGYTVVNKPIFKNNHSKWPKKVKLVSLTYWSRVVSIPSVLNVDFRLISRLEN
ncbi:hypothetical protein TNIN_184211 [Trichonephila inaurata madagascariensis]|uniref:Uncharacterized protein n=1 Tax=Trichonephila inaurata madagascariensis TaxID=2747483 RepID=A0A8X6MGL6_9ARAC|nr:hypothetical protein TNIN_184211 [Trichonephila inaurata madagascariensis]